MTPAASANSDNTECCPVCGDLVAELDEYTGFCLSCAKSHPLKSPLEQEQQLEQWLTANADHLEFYMAQGHTLSVAAKLVSAERRPVCLACGAVIQRAPKNSVICRKTAYCRRMSRRYVYLYTDKGLTKAQALAQIMSELS